MRGMQEPPLTATQLEGGWLVHEWSSCYPESESTRCIQSRHVECGKVGHNSYDNDLTSSRSPIVPPVVQLRRPGIQPQQNEFYHQRPRPRQYSTLCQGKKPSGTQKCPQLHGCLLKGS